jgi:hypothetical protein
MYVARCTLHFCTSRPQTLPLPTLRTVIRAGSAARAQASPSQCGASMPVHQVLYRFTSDLDGYLSPALPLAGMAARLPRCSGCAVCGTAALAPLAEAGTAAPADSPLSLMWVGPVDHADLGCELSLHRGRLVACPGRAPPSLSPGSPPRAGRCGVERAKPYARVHEGAAHTRSGTYTVLRRPTRSWT